MLQVRNNSSLRISLCFSYKLLDQLKLMKCARRSGTGKTRVVVKAVFHLLAEFGKLNQKKRILVCATSECSADVLTLEMGKMREEYKRMKCIPPKCRFFHVFSFRFLLPYVSIHIDDSENILFPQCYGLLVCHLSIRRSMSTLWMNR